MSQRESGYDRVEHDAYETPAWATVALLPHLPDRLYHILEPAAGSGKMVEVLKTRFRVEATDIKTGFDFLGAQGLRHDAIITNPPYALATEFIDHALLQMQKTRGLVAMLLRTDFDHAKTRAHLFARNTAFAKKIVLTKRIRWIEGSTGSPSFNHAWFVWDWQHQGAPVLAYDLQ